MTMLPAAPVDDRDVKAEVPTRMTMSLGAEPQPLRRARATEAPVETAPEEELA